MRYLEYADIGTWSVWWSMSEAVKHSWSYDFYFIIYTYLKVNYFSLFLQLSPLILHNLFVLLVIYVMFSFQSVSLQFIWAYVLIYHSHWGLIAISWNNLYGRPKIKSFEGKSFTYFEKDSEKLFCFILSQRNNAMEKDRNW